jgi:hypothetical protein
MDYLKQVTERWIADQDKRQLQTERLAAEAHPLFSRQLPGGQWLARKGAFIGLGPTEGEAVADLARKIEHNFLARLPGEG